MKAESRFVVVLAGGRGERFWPASTTRRPKQFLAFPGDESLLTQTLQRAALLVPRDHIWVITQQSYVEETRILLADHPADRIVGEPQGRDTAPAVALALALVMAHDPGGVFAVLPADHVIHDTTAFAHAIDQGFRIAEREDVLVTFGVRPQHPSTAFGYIEIAEPIGGGNLGDMGSGEVYRVARFVEKPDAETAREYLRTGRYYWNSGMFVWSARTLLAALRRHASDLAEGAERLADAVRHGKLEAVAPSWYALVRRISIDYALMEKAENVWMIAAPFDWDDVGTWLALRRHRPADAAGNVTAGLAEIVEGRGNTVYSTEGLTVLYGVTDLVVVRAHGVTLVCHRDRAESLKKLLEHLRQNDEYEPFL